MKKPLPPPPPAAAARRPTESQMERVRQALRFTGAVLRRAHGPRVPPAVRM